MVMRFIRHITLTTGHARDSFAGEVSPEALAVCRPIVARLSPERQPVPGFPEYEITGARWRRHLVMTVWRDDAPLVTMGVALHSREGAALWRTLHKNAELPVASDPNRCPPEPWAAVLIHVGLALHPEAGEWLGDFERCVAWAFYAQIND